MTKQLFQAHRKRLTKAVFIVLALSGFTACSQEQDSKRESHADTVQANTEGAFPLHLTDAYGRTFTFDKPVSRIISFAPNLTEVLCYLGAADRIVGRTDYCTYPPKINTVPSIGTLNSYNYEKILELRPDIVLMMTFDGSSRTEYNKLADLGLVPFALDGQSIQGVLGGIDTVGMLLGHYKVTRHRTDSLRVVVDSLRQHVAQFPPVPTFVVIDRSPLITVADGFIDEVLRTAGGENIAAGDPVAYPVFSREMLLHKNPEVILVPSISESEPVLDALTALYPEWNQLSAVKNNRVYAVPRDIIARPGPRIVDGLTYVARILHGAKNR